MARHPRLILSNHPHHVIQRGNNRSDIFTDDEDYQYYLEKLAVACERFFCQLHAYVLMTNHVHLLMTPKVDTGVSKVMQSTGRNYAHYFNQKYDRTGTLWDGRYRNTIVDIEEYLLTCYRYIELNPVRAETVSHPSEYPWSSYAANALGHDDELITVHRAYLKLGGNHQSRQQSYRSLFKRRISKQILNEIRESTNNSWVLGSDKFKKKVEKLSSRQASPKQRGGDRRSKNFHRTYSKNKSA